MSDQIQTLPDFTDADLEAMLHRALRNTLIVGVLAALVLWKASSWRDAAMMATGTAISVLSIYEWRRLARFIKAAMDRKQSPAGAGLAILFFLLRLIVFAALIYGSLKCFQGSGVALLCGLALSLLAIVWEALRMLRN